MKSLFQFARTFPYKHQDLFFIILAYAVFAIGGALYWAAIPILSDGVFMLSTFHAGLIMASIGVVYILTDGPIGVLLDYVGYKKGAAIAVLFSGVTAVISLFEPSMPMFLVGIFFFAFSWNAMTLATSAYILYNVPKAAEGSVFGAYGSLYKFGALISTFFIGFIAQWGFVRVGLFYLFVAMISLFLILFFVNSEKRFYDHNLRHAIASYWRAPSQWKRGWQAMKEFYPVSWVSALDGFIGYITSSILWFVIPLSLAQFRNPFLPEGIVLGVYEFAGVIFLGVGGYLADRYSRKRLFLTFLLIMGFASVALGFASQLSVFLILTFILAAALDSTTAPVDAMLAQVDKKHDKDATIFGFIGIFTDFAFIIGPITSGLLLEKFGLQGVFFFLGALVLINWLASAWLLRNFDGKPRVMIKKRIKVHLGGMPKHHKS